MGDAVVEGTIEVGAAPGQTRTWHRRAGATPTHLTHVGALDGVRGLAVLGVIAFHLGLSWAPGGFLGVDAFFVLSGYLITALLVRERERAHRIRLLAFWGRRARRLLPAMLLLLGAIVIYARLFTPGEDLDRLRGDAIATLGYYANWHFIAGNTGYFEHVRGDLTAAPHVVTRRGGAVLSRLAAAGVRSATPAPSAARVARAGGLGRRGVHHRFGGALRVGGGCVPHLLRHRHQGARHPRRRRARAVEPERRVGSAPGDGGQGCTSPGWSGSRSARGPGRTCTVKRASTTRAGHC